MTRHLPVLLLLSFDGECGDLFPDLDVLYSDQAETCGLDLVVTVSPECSLSDHPTVSECISGIDALTCEQLSAEVIPEACRKVCQDPRK